MTVELELDALGTWQEIGAFAFIIDKERKINVEVANADGLPTGVVPCHFNRRDDLQRFDAPVSGSWYARSVGLPNKITITEV